MTRLLGLSHAYGYDNVDHDHPTEERQAVGLNTDNENHGSYICNWDTARQPLIMKIIEGFWPRVYPGDERGEWPEKDHALPQKSRSKSGSKQNVRDASFRRTFAD